MNSGSILKNIKRQKDGTYTTTYGDYMLRTAFQPIFGTDAAGRLELTAFEGLVRASLDGQEISPGAFFDTLDAGEMQHIDSLCRTLHILNLGQMDRQKTKLFVNFHPGLFTTIHDIRQEVDKISVATYEAGLTPDRIVCEIAHSPEEKPDNVALLATRLRNLGFRTAVDEYGAQDSDAERVKLIKPHFVKFEAGWVLDFMNNPTGYALLKVMVEQFKDRGILPIFEALEEIDQVDLCQELGVPLMQGYVLARPEIAPTNFNAEYPESILPTSKKFVSTPPVQPGAGTQIAGNPQRRQTTFGKRGA